TCWLYVKCAIRTLCESLVLLPFFFFLSSQPSILYTLSLHDALPIWKNRRRLPIARHREARGRRRQRGPRPAIRRHRSQEPQGARSEEHTSELQSRSDLVCRLLLEKKKVPSLRVLHLPPAVEALARLP